MKKLLLFILLMGIVIPALAELPLLEGIREAIRKNVIYFQNSSD